VSSLISCTPYGAICGPYFDPSYGKLYNNPADFESKSVAGYIYVAPAAPGIPPGFYAARQPLSSTPNIRLAP